MVDTGADVVWFRFYRGGINRVSLSVSLSKKDTRAVTSSRGVIPRQPDKPRSCPRCWSATGAAVAEGTLNASL